MVFIYTWQHQRVAVTLEPQNPYVYYGYYKAKDLQPY